MVQHIRVGTFTPNILITIAEANDFLANEDISAEIDSVINSATLLRNLIDGEYDVILANADNVISWCEGQGADPNANDLVIFLGGSRGVNQKLVLAPGVRDLSELRGKVFAVDAPNTGYAIAGIYILKKEGLEFNRDYIIKSFGNTAARANAMSRGEASAAMIGMLDEEIDKRGFRVVARAAEYVKHYARGLSATRRQWAWANEDLLVRYCRAMIRAGDWLQDRTHKDETIGMLRKKMEERQAQALYLEAFSAEFGLEPRSRIDIEGIRGAMTLRQSAGLMKPPLPNPDKYVDKRFYINALATL
jgi:ABC-type nitrate/sulfonate/bicarbonate transport system substrate-binding protein